MIENITIKEILNIIKNSKEWGHALDDLSNKDYYLSVETWRGSSKTLDISLDNESEINGKGVIILPFTLHLRDKKEHQ